MEKREIKIAMRSNIQNKGIKNHFESRWTRMIHKSRIDDFTTTVVPIVKLDRVRQAYGRVCFVRVHCDASFPRENAATQRSEMQFRRLVNNAALLR